MLGSGIIANFNWWNKMDFSCTVIKALSGNWMESLQGWLCNQSSDSPENSLSILWFIPNVQNNTMPKTWNKKISLCFCCLAIVWILYTYLSQNQQLTDVHLQKTKQNTSRYDLIYCEHKLFLIFSATEETGRNNINMN